MWLYTSPIPDSVGFVTVPGVCNGRELKLRLGSEWETGCRNLIHYFLDWQGKTDIHTCMRTHPYTHACRHNKHTHSFTHSMTHIHTLNGAMESEFMYSFTHM